MSSAAGPLWAAGYIDAMRTARLLGVILTVLGAGLLLAPSAGAQPPLQLTDYVTDDAGALSEPGRAAVTSAVDKLYAERHVRLWVVYVDTFSGQDAENWGRATRGMSDLGDYDALLAVATTGRAYAFLVPSAIKTVNSAQVDNLRREKIEPALRNGDWSGAALAAANGLDPATHSSSKAVLLAALGVIAVAVLVLLVVMRYRARRRRADAGGSGAVARQRRRPSGPAGVRGPRRQRHGGDGRRAHPRRPARWGHAGRVRRLDPDVLRGFTWRLVRRGADGWRRPILTAAALNWVPLNRIVPPGTWYPGAQPCLIKRGSAPDAARRR
ncbi:transmembrane protein [Mycobacterium bohemicum DSM 44277]|uniref:Transmembrane protein n=1 Tax=Mycobacterium bohemicum DSM 44277 TaxID=1236609 RepID=A0A0U0W256_MYCBE|nr:transmembrane protein [Mycobacterium bohemicum DSM 44277]